MGKGDKPRPFSVSKDIYYNNWHSAFGKWECKECEETNGVEDSACRWCGLERALYQEEVE